jgi:hypothetical protein
LLGGVALFSFARSSIVREAIEWLATNQILVGLSATLYAMLFVVRRRAHLRAEQSQSWLIAAPIPVRAFRRVTAIRVALAIAGQALLLIALLIGLGFANQYAPADLSHAIGGWIIGIALGSFIGASWPQKLAVQRTEASRFVPKASAKPTAPSLAGLSRWPIAKAVAWHRPENSRALFIIAALSVPVGAPALLGIAILAVWTLGSYLIAVMRAVPAVAREASIWLRPTTLPFASFAWAIGRRAFVHQFIGTVLLAAVFVFLGGRIADVVYFAGLWLALTVMIGMIGIRQSYLSLSSSGRTLLCVLLVLAAESRARGWGLPITAILMLAHMRGGTRGRT